MKKKSKGQRLRLFSEPQYIPEMEDSENAVSNHLFGLYTADEARGDCCMDEIGIVFSVAMNARM